MKTIKLIIRLLLVVLFSPPILFLFIFKLFLLLCVPHLVTFPIAWLMDDDEDIKETKEDVIAAFLDFGDNMKEVVAFVKNKPL